MYVCIHTYIHKYIVYIYYICAHIYAHMCICVLAIGKTLLCLQLYFILTSLKTLFTCHFLREELPFLIPLHEIALSIHMPQLIFLHNDSHYAFIHLFHCLYFSIKCALHAGVGGSIFLYFFHHYVPKTQSHTCHRFDTQ